MQKVTSNMWQWLVQGQGQGRQGRACSRGRPLVVVVVALEKSLGARLRHIFMRLLLLRCFCCCCFFFWPPTPSSCPPSRAAMTAAPAHLKHVLNLRSKHVHRHFSLGSHSAPPPALPGHLLCLRFLFVYVNNFYVHIHCIYSI